MTTLAQQATARAAYQSAGVPTMILARGRARFRTFSAHPEVTYVRGSLKEAPPMIGRHLPDAPIGEFPVDYDALQPGDYWFVTVRRDHPAYPRRLNVREHPEDQRWWGNDPPDPRFAQNLTGLVLGIITPDRRYGQLCIHTVREEDDDTVSVRPGDGSSNSILVGGGGEPGQWHGYIEHGEWRPC